MKRISLVAAAVTAAAAAAGCQSMMGGEKPIVAVAEMKATTAAGPANLNPVGVVRFSQLGASKVMVEAEIKGLKPNSEHGFHVHAVPDCSGDGTKTGAHFNPDAHPHNHPGQMIRHAGAMFNLKTDANGTGTPHRSTMSSSRSGKVDASSRWARTPGRRRWLPGTTWTMPSPSPWPPSEHQTITERNRVSSTKLMSTCGGTAVDSPGRLRMKARVRAT